MFIMKDELRSAKDVTTIAGVSLRQVLNWAEKGLIKPKKPAKKAGTRRGYDYLNLLEFGLARYLLDIIGVQFYTAKTILEELREDGEIHFWAANYAKYALSFSRKIKNKEKDELVGSHLRTVVDPQGLDRGTLYYILVENELTIETIRIISPWDLTHTLKAFDYEGLENIIESNGMIVVNMGKIKQEINSKIGNYG